MEVSDQSVHAEVEALGSHIGDTVRIIAPSHHLPTPCGSEKHNRSLTLNNQTLVSKGSILGHGWVKRECKIVIIDNLK